MEMGRVVPLANLSLKVLSGVSLEWVVIGLELLPEYSDVVHSDDGTCPHLPLG